MLIENNLAITEEKLELQELLDDLTEEYLNKGGSIKDIPAGTTALKGDKPLPFVKVS